jgi:hypothetical protein
MKMLVNENMNIFVWEYLDDNYDFLEDLIEKVIVKLRCVYIIRL